MFNSHYLTSTSLYFSSDKATNSLGDSQKVFQLNKPLRVPNGSHLQIALSSFSCPYTFYLVRGGVNDTFKVSTLYSGIWVEDVIITIEEGNYEITELINHVNESFIASQGELRTLMRLAYNYTTSKFYITTTIQMSSVIISDITCYKIMGTVQDINYTYTDLSTLQFPNCADIGGTSVLYIALKNLHLQNENSYNEEGVLACVNVEVLPLQYIFYHPISEIFFETNSMFVNNFDISILDENMKQIDFNGGVWRVGFTIHYNYDNEYVVPKDLRLIEDTKKQIKETIEKT
jgi:hypothetical protein